MATGRAARTSPIPHEEPVRLIGQMSTQGEGFGCLWASHDVLKYRHRHKPYNRPLVGDLTFGYESLDLTDDLGVVFLSTPSNPPRRPTMQCNCSPA